MRKRNNQNKMCKFLQWFVPSLSLSLLAPSRDIHAISHPKNKKPFINRLRWRYAECKHIGVVLSMKTKTECERIASTTRKWQSHVSHFRKPEIHSKPNAFKWTRAIMKIYTICAKWEMTPSKLRFLFILNLNDFIYYLFKFRIQYVSRERDSVFSPRRHRGEWAIAKILFWKIKLRIVKIRVKWHVLCGALSAPLLGLHTYRMSSLGLGGMIAILEFPYIVNSACNTYRLFFVYKRTVHERGAHRKTDGASIL